MKEKADHNNSEKPTDGYSSILEFSRKEIEFVRTAYKWLAGILGIIIVAGGFLTYNNFQNLNKELKELKDESKSDINSFKEDSKTQIESYTNQLKSELEIETLEIRNAIKEKVEEEFDKEKIQSLVEQKAKERIDKIADQIIESKIKEKIEPKITSTLTKISFIENNIKKDKEFIDEISSVVGEIALILPDATGYGAGTTEQQSKYLKEKAQYLKSKLKEIKHN